MPSVKIHAFLAHAGIASRRVAEQMVADGKVSVNGKPATIGQRVDPNVDQVSVQHKIIKQGAHHQYILLYKPVGYVSTTSDELGRPTVLDLVPATSQRLYPVGRLDAESEGLMLMTNDGELAYQLTHPKFEIPKTYEVELNQPISENAFHFLEKGAKLADGWLIPESVIILPQSPKRAWLRITIKEGRKHVIRRLLRRAGYQVMRLIRVELGPFSVDDLSGQPWRQLKASEVETLLATLPPR